MILFYLRVTLSVSHSSRKLAPKYVGPFPILARIGPSSYRLQLPERFKRTHPVFHASLLKPHHGPAPLEQEPAFVDAQGIAEYEVEAILAHRQAGRRG